MTDAEAPRKIAQGVAHDLYHSIGLLKNYTKFLARDLSRKSRNNPRIKEDLEIISDAVIRAEALARALMQFSHAHDPSPTIFNLNDVVSENMMLLSSFPAVQIEYRLASDLHVLKADRTQVQQVLWNLAINARDAMGASGGKIVVETYNTTDPDDLPLVALSVCDTGPGIPEKLFARIFEPMFSTKHDGVHGSIGLGLTTVQGIVQHAGGTIEVTSSLGEGARFCIYFPAGFLLADHG
jgi:two-component system cell cycle sensor histidine kinase/response regulator CckA